MDAITEGKYLLAKEWLISLQIVDCYDAQALLRSNPGNLYYV